MITITPNKNDILLGRGGKKNKNEGNLILRHLSKKHASLYTRSSKSKKAEIIDSLLAQIYSSKPEIRFLLQDKDTGEWELATKCTSREKVSQGLRDAARKRNKDQNRNSFSVEFHSGSQGLPGYYEEEDCYVIGSFKSYNISQAHCNEKLHEQYPKSVGVEAIVPLQKCNEGKENRCHNLIDHTTSSSGHSSGSRGDSSSITSRYASSHQMHYHHSYQSNHVSPTSSEYPSSPSSQSTISSYNDNQFSNLTNQQRPQSPCHQRKRSSTYTSCDHENRLEEPQNKKRRKQSYEMEPVPFRQNPTQVEDSSDDSFYSSSQDFEFNYENLQIFDWI